MEHPKSLVSEEQSWTGHWSCCYSNSKDTWITLPSVAEYGMLLKSSGTWEVSRRPGVIGCSQAMGTMTEQLAFNPGWSLIHKYVDQTLLRIWIMGNWIVVAQLGQLGGSRNVPDCNSETAYVHIWSNLDSQTAANCSFDFQQPLL
jgi:hypothetical protein